METQEALHEIAALRHNFHVNHRLRLEFLGNLSKLLRDYEIHASDELLGSLVLSVPEEILHGHSNGNGNGHHTVQAADADKSAVPPASPDRTAQPPAPARTAVPPAPARTAVPPAPARTVPPPAAPSRTAVPPRSPDSTALPPRAPS